MARYLVIEFDDDAQADALRAQIDTATAKGKKFRVVGLFGRPKTFCSCYIDKTNMTNSRVRGAKFGWWVCTTCRRARLGDHQANNLILGAGMDTTITSVGVDQLEVSPRARDWILRPLSLSLSLLPKK